MGAWPSSTQSGKVTVPLLFERIPDFILNRMRMSRIYKPVMIGELLGGIASIRDLASALLARDDAVATAITAASAADTVRSGGCSHRRRKVDGHTFRKRIRQTLIGWAGNSDRSCAASKCCFNSSTVKHTPCFLCTMRWQFAHSTVKSVRSLDVSPLLDKGAMW
jgi:hypothetical protein